MISVLIWFVLNIIIGPALFDWLLINPFISLAVILGLTVNFELWLSSSVTWRDICGTWPIWAYLLTIAYYVEAARTIPCFVYPLKALFVLGIIFIIYILKTNDEPADIKRKLSAYKLW